MKFVWEKIDADTERAMVYGGWLIRSRDIDACNTYYTVESMVFVPDEKHKWKISK